MSEHNVYQSVRSNFAILIISDTRSLKTDESGKTANLLIKKKGHKVLIHKIIGNNKDIIRSTIDQLILNPKINVIITIGGTGISKRDITVEVISEYLNKKIEGFGELFRNLSYQEIGEAAMISRAIAGTINDKIVFCLPGSKNAVKLAFNRIILSGLGHIIWEIKR